MNNPYEECLIQTLCIQMCERAFPYYQTLTFVDPNFSSYKHSKKEDILMRQMIEEAEDVKEKQKIRDRANLIRQKERRSI